MRLLQLNYLHYALGSALSQMRTDTAKIFSKKMTIGESMYRMIEAGSAQFPTASVFALMQVLPEIQFERFSKLIVMAKSLNGCDEHETVMMCQFFVSIEPDIQPLVTYWDDHGRNSILGDPAKKKELGVRAIEYLTKPFESKILDLEHFLTENPQSITLLKKLHDGLLPILQKSTT